MQDKSTTVRRSASADNKAKDKGGVDDKPKPATDIWQRLDEEYAKRKPPEDAFTVRDYADRYNITRYAAVGAIQRLENSGVVECIGMFGSRNEKYYRLKDKDEKSQVTNNNAS